MRKFAVVAVLGALAAMASGEILLDQIGANTSATDNQNVYASQEFEAAYATYNIAVIDDFVVPAGGRQLTNVEAVIGWWNASVFNPAAITGWRVEVYSSAASAGGNLIGNSFHYVATPAGATYVNWGTSSLGQQNYKVSIPVNASLPAGTYYVGVMPMNPFATNGQTGIAGSTLGGGANAYQACPTGAFGSGTLWNIAVNGAYRVEAIPEPASLILLALAGLIRRR